MNDSNNNENISMSVAQLEAMIKAIQGSDNSGMVSDLNSSLSDTHEKIKSLADGSRVIKDHYSNSLTGAGTNTDQPSFTNYGFSNDTLNWTLWLALYNDSWVFRRAIDKPAQDEVNSGISINGSEDYTKIYKAYDKFKPEFTQLLMWGALFGGSVAVMMFENIGVSEMKKPINKKKIKGKRFKLYVTDRWYGGFAKTDEMVTNMKDIDYGTPKYYDINFPDGSTYTVHHSYVLRYEHRIAPPLIKRGQLMGWGYAEGAHILNELARDDQLKSAITSLVNKSLIEVIKMSGMRGVFMGTDKGNESQLMKRLEMVNWGRSYNSLTFLDKDDDYQQHQLGALAGLSQILEVNMWQIASALEMQGILYGELKGGLSADTDAFKHYATTIKNRCNTYFRPVLNKFLKILWIVYDVKGQPDFEFNRLDRDVENNAIMEAIDKFSTVLSGMEQNGIISKYQYAKSIQDFLQFNSINISISDEYLNKLKLEEEQKILDTIKELSDKGRNLSTPDFDTNKPGLHISRPSHNNFENEESIEPEISEPNIPNNKTPNLGENISNEEGPNEPI